MKSGFLQSYLDGFASIHVFFTFDAALTFIAYNQLIRSEGISGDVLEIGVHHGLSTIAVGFTSSTPLIHKPTIGVW